MSKRMKNDSVLVDDNEATPPVLTHTALGVFKDEKGHWHVSRVKFNPETKQVGEMEVVPYDEVTRDAVIFKFKIMASEEVLN